MKLLHYGILLAIFVIIAVFVKLSYANSTTQLETYDSSKKDVFTYYYLPNCKYCQEFTPTWNQLKMDMSNMELQMKQIDMSQGENHHLAETYGISSYPSLLLHKRNGDIKRFEGQRTPTKLKQFIRENI